MVLKPSLMRPVFGDVRSDNVSRRSKVIRDGKDLGQVSITKHSEGRPPHDVSLKITNHGKSEREMMINLIFMLAYR